ncbi:MAG: AMP-binding protein [Roseiflexaceae bacterium]|nr:AMP-binding protein [Roseiflexaceae bacterium]
MTTIHINIAAFLPAQAQQRPDQLAVVMQAGKQPRHRYIYTKRGGYEALSFAELDSYSNALAWGLVGYGIAPGQRVLLMVPAGLPLIALTFALFKIGAAPILIDPAMGRQNLAQCIGECQPEAMIGVPRAHLLRALAPAAFRRCRRYVVAGRNLLGAASLDTLEATGRTVAAAFPTANVAADDLAAIVFTTGSTGVPKGVLYEYGMFQAQCAVLRDHFQIQPGEIEMPAFPLFALFNVAMGVTSAIPPIDPTRPASCNPAEVIAFIEDVQVTSTFGSPAIWDKVTRYAQAAGLGLPSLRRVLMAGAPVPQAIHQRFLDLLSPEANTYTPYGATEALPVASISGREVLHAHAERADPTAGTCVGRAVPGVDLRVIAIIDAPIAQWDDALELPINQVGEIVVAGAMVTKTYLARPEATKLAKIQDGARTWHRMGDLGYLDDNGRLWFYGRKTHRVITAAGTLYTEPVELVFNQHPAVARSALVGIGSTGSATPMIVIEPAAGRMPQSRAARAAFVAELRDLGARHAVTARLTTFLFHPSFPVDIRHNAKIFREKLAVWAAKQNKQSLL